MQLVDIPNAGEGASAIWERLLLIPLPVIIFWIIFVIYKSIKNEQKKGQYKEDTSKICSDCLASIPKLAKKCMHCGTEQEAEQQKAEQVAKVSYALQGKKWTSGMYKGKIQICTNCKLDVGQNPPKCPHCKKLIWKLRFREE
jgi:hypothetical protein